MLNRGFHRSIPGRVRKECSDKNEPRGKNAPQYVACGTLLGRYKSIQVCRMIAGGGFGQIYEAVNLETDESVAVKVERATGNDSQRMIMEAKVLEAVVGREHFPRVFYVGPFGRYNYIVMEMLGMNLGDIRKSMPNRKISRHSAVRIGIQIIEGLEILHNVGYLHRDFKPTNCCVGLGPKRKNVYLVDFGMSRRFLNEDGSFRSPRNYCGFRGTTRYCSYRMHDRREQGPVDDLWCFYYSLAELVEGSLPWKNIESTEEMAHAKKILKHADIYRSMPSRFQAFETELKRLRQDSTPDYERFKSILASCVKFVDTNAEFEWDE